MTIEKLDQAIDHLEDRARTEIANAEATAARFRALIPQLRDLTETFARDGVVYVPRQMQQRLEHFLGQKAHTYLRDVATSLSRIPVFGLEGDHYAYTYSNGGYQNRSLTYVELALPRNKRTENLVAGLLLISQKINSLTDTIGMTAPVAKEETARTWTFYFLDEPGRKIFDDFMEQCRTNPVFRIILKGTAR